MSTIIRLSLLLVSAAVAALLTWAFSAAPVVWVPEPSDAFRLVINVAYRLIGFIFFVALLLPVWLPAVVPTKFNKQMRAIQWVCASLLFAVVVGLLTLMVAMASTSKFLISVSLFTGLAAAIHTQGARSSSIKNAA